MCSTSSSTPALASLTPCSLHRRGRPSSDHSNEPRPRRRARRPRRPPAPSCSAFRDVRRHVGFDRTNWAAMPGKTPRRASGPGSWFGWARRSPSRNSRGKSRALARPKLPSGPPINHASYALRRHGERPSGAAVRDAVRLASAAAKFGRSRLAAWIASFERPGRTFPAERGEAGDLGRCLSDLSLALPPRNQRASPGRAAPLAAQSLHFKRAHPDPGTPPGGKARGG